MALIRTPHAAIIVFNYNDRLSTKGVTKTFDEVNEVIISTVSLVSISTNKTKSTPVGTFNFALAPTRNWVSVLTPGSWCVIMMSNELLVKDSFTKANAKQVKMFGRIETVRVNVAVDDEGARSTTYVVSGQDWGSIFNNMVYVDPIIQDPSDKGRVAACALYQQFVNNIFDSNGDPLYLNVPKNLNTILSIIGHPVKLPETDRLAKATHDVSMPSKLSTFFKFIDGFDEVSPSTKFTELLTLVWGPLLKKEDDYDNKDPEQTGICVLDPFAMVGQHSLWSILQENSNYALNEMYSEMYWPDDKGGPQLLLYNRIKPFSYTKDPASPDKIDVNMRSKFQLIASHKLDDEAIINANAGTNWTDKFNFIEIKPDVNELQVLGVLLKAKSQAYQGDNASSDVFNREGFRPISFSIKQLPFNTKTITDPIQASKLEQWVHLMKEWYFDCHKLLNGHVVLQGSSEYIPVGDNIMFDAELIGVTHNYNSASIGKEKIFVLGHVESVQNNFTVNSDGTRSFQTTIQFVRGILVDKSKNLIGEGTIDTLASTLQDTDSNNSRTVYEAVSSNDPKK
jgi:hypothetical protein